MTPSDLTSLKKSILSDEQRTGTGKHIALRRSFNLALANFSRLRGGASRSRYHKLQAAFILRLTQSGYAAAAASWLRFRPTSIMPTTFCTKADRCMLLSETLDQHVADREVVGDVLAAVNAAKPISGGSLLTTVALGAAGAAAIHEIVQHYATKTMASSDKLAKALAGALAAGATAAALMYIGGQLWGRTGMKTVTEALQSAFLWTKGIVVSEATPCGFKTRLLPSALKWLGDGAALAPTGDTYTLTAKAIAIWFLKGSGQVLESAFHCQQRDMNFYAMTVFLQTYVPIVVAAIGAGVTWATLKIPHVTKAYGILRDIIYKVLTSTLSKRTARVELADGGRPAVTVHFKALDTKRKLDELRLREINLFKNCRKVCTADGLCGKAKYAQKNSNEQKRLGRLCAACILDCKGMRRFARPADASSAAARQRRWHAQRHEGGRRLVGGAHDSGAKAKHRKVEEENE